MGNDILTNQENKNDLEISNDAWIAESADVVGKVKIGDDSSVWYHATLRGDENQISVGRMTSIQDGTVVHVDAMYPCIIGDRTTIGHNCIIHGCKVGNNTLIGMGSIILSGAEIGNNCIVGAGSLVTGKFKCTDGQLILGSPAKVVRSLKNEDYEMIDKGVETYVRLTREQNNIRRKI